MNVDQLKTNPLLQVIDLKFFFDKNVTPLSCTYHLLAVSHIWWSTETLSSSSLLMESSTDQKRCFKTVAWCSIWRWVTSPQLQAWKHDCETTGTVQTCVCSLEEQDNRWTSLLKVLWWDPSPWSWFSLALCRFRSSALVRFSAGVSLSTQANTLVLTAVASGGIPMLLKGRHECLNGKGRATWMIRTH